MLYTFLGGHTGKDRFINLTEPSYLVGMFQVTSFAGMIHTSTCCLVNVYPVTHFLYCSLMFFSGGIEILCLCNIFLFLGNGKGENGI